MKKYSQKPITKTLLIALFTLTIMTSPLFAKTITVKQDSTGDYTTISSAVSGALTGDTIEVYPGQYQEAVVIDKNISLKGIDPRTTIIQSPSDGVTVNKNIIATISGFTITAGQDGIYLNLLSTSTIKNNILVSNGRHGIHLPYTSYTGTSINTSIINNVIAFNGDSGIYAYSPYTMMNIHNNIIYSNGIYGIYDKRKSASISYNNVYNGTNYSSGVCSSSCTGDISQDPQFVDSNAGNYALQSGSSCIDAGQPGTADADPDGTRNDMGVFGGPDAANFWPYSQGSPTVSSLNVSPSVVSQGDNITINATGVANVQ